MSKALNWYVCLFVVVLLISSAYCGIEDDVWDDVVYVGNDVEDHEQGDHDGQGERMDHGKTTLDEYIPDVEKATHGSHHLVMNDGEKLKFLESGKSSVKEDVVVQSSMSVFRWPKQDNYYKEIAVVIYLVVFVANYVIGKKRNRNIANNFSKEFNDLYSQHFTSTRRSGKVQFFPESHSDFEHYSTGHLNCYGYLLSLRLKKRQDILSMIFGTLFRRSEDVVRITIALEHLDPFIFCVLPISKVQDYRDQNPDVAQLKSYHSVGTSFTVLTDVSSMAEKIMHPLLRREMQRNNTLFKLFHISDCNTRVFPNRKKTICFEFVIPKEMKELRPLLKMSIEYIQKMSHFRLPSDVFEKNLKTRERAESSKSVPKEKSADEEVFKKRNKRGKAKLLY